MTIGQVPLAASLCVTTKSISAVHPSLIEGLPVSASKAETEVTAVGAAAILQPSIVVDVILPLTTGAVLSILVLYITLLCKPHASFAVTVITAVQVPEVLTK